MEFNLVTRTQTCLLLVYVRFYLCLFLFTFQVSMMDSLVTALDAELVVAGETMTRALGNRCRAAHAVLNEVTKVRRNGWGNWGLPCGFSLPFVSFLSVSVPVSSVFVLHACPSVCLSPYLSLYVCQSVSLADPLLPLPLSLFSISLSHCLPVCQSLSVFNSLYSRKNIAEAPC